MTAVPVCRGFYGTLGHFQARGASGSTSSATFVLSADYGGPDTPVYLNALGIAAGYVAPETWDTQAPIGAIKQRLGIHGELIEQYSHPYIYLSPEVTRRDAIEEIERALADVPVIQMRPSPRGMTGPAVTLSL